MWGQILTKISFFSNQDEAKNDLQETKAVSAGDMIKKKQPLSSVCRNVEPTVLVHGGAGFIPDHIVPAKMKCVKKAAEAGHKVLRDGGSSVEAVEAAIKVMEDDPIMNAGYGSVLNRDGEVEADACIMVGENLDAGGVAAVKDIANPISLAKAVMEKTPHVLLVGDGARKFAIENSYPLAPPGSLVTTAARNALDFVKKHPEAGAQLENWDLKENLEDYEYCVVNLETVGAVVCDKHGRLAAGTSTGGLCGQIAGRVGDSPLIGKGAYCDDDLGGVSITGHGESITEFCLSMRILKEVEQGKSAQEATETALEQMNERLKHKAGAICLTRTGDIGMYWTTPRMSWAYQKGHTVHFGIDPGVQQSEKAAD